MGTADTHHFVRRKYRGEIPGKEAEALPTGYKEHTEHTNLNGHRCASKVGSGHGPQKAWNSRHVSQTQYSEMSDAGRAPNHMGETMYKGYLGCFNCSHNITKACCNDQVKRRQRQPAQPRRDKGKSTVWAPWHRTSYSCTLTAVTELTTEDSPQVMSFKPNLSWCEPAKNPSSFQVPQRISL